MTSYNRERIQQCTLYSSLPRARFLTVRDGIHAPARTQSESQVCFYRSFRKAQRAIEKKLSRQTRQTNVTAVNDIPYNLCPNKLEKKKQKHAHLPPIFAPIYLRKQYEPPNRLACKQSIRLGREMSASIFPEDQSVGRAHTKYNNFNAIAESLVSQQGRIQIETSKIDLNIP